MNNNKLSSEIHCMIIWEKCSLFQEKIIEDLKNKYSVLFVFNSMWNSEEFLKNLSKLYMKNIRKEEYLLKKSNKFTIIIFKDDSPRYSLEKTYKGISLVNTRIYTYKREYRKFVQNKPLIHISETIDEADNNLKSLFNLEQKDLLEDNIRFDVNFGLFIDKNNSI